MDNVRLINIGLGNIISVNRIIAVVGSDSAPVKKIIKEARESAALIDATMGRKARAVIVIDSGQIVLTMLKPETVKERLA